MTVCRSLSVCVLAACLLAPGAWGDVVTLTTGSRIEGRITRQTSTNITIETTGGMILTFTRDRIASIEEADEWQNRLTLGEGYVRQGDYQRAAEQFEQALQHDPPEAQRLAIEERLEQAQAAITQMVTETRQREMQTLDELVSRARQELRRGDHAAALESLEEAERLNPTADRGEEITRLRAQALYAQAYSLHDRLDQTGALAVLEELREVDPNHQDGLNLYRRIIESQPLDSAETVAEIEQIVANNPGRLDMQARLGEYYSRRQDWDRALPHLQAAAASELYFTQVRSRLRQAMLAQVSRATQSGDFDAAIEMYDELLQRFPDEDENYLNVLIYHRERSRLAEDDLDGRMALAQQCLDNGYDNWARELMNGTLERDPNHPAALAMHRRFAEDALAAAMQDFNAENYALAMMQFQNLIEQYNYADLIEQAQLRLADVQRIMRERQRNRAEQAQQLAAQGDEYAAIARQNLAAWQEGEYNPRQNFVAVRGMTRRDTVVRYLRRAISCYEAALELDSSLGPLENGGLNVKLADARSDLSLLENGRFPTRERAFSRN
ncbi:MAG: tetratricopeptide repeat protein [Candidatus Sumerlaeia bacterium]|nr:tetratricopeptide repeat protein [Candidatus Sumerlaeia bacterium]